MTTDQRMDDLLRQAGETWRAGHDVTVDVERIALPAVDAGRGRTAVTLTSARPGVARRRLVGGLVAVAVTGAAVVAGVASVVGGTPDPPPVTSSPAAGPGDLIDTAWALTSATAGGTPVALPSSAPAPELVFVDGRFGAGDGCNHHGGSASITATTLTLTPGYSTLVACGSQANALFEVLSGTSSWSVDAGVLTIVHEGVGTLVYRSTGPAPSGMFAPPSGTPAVTAPSGPTPSGS